jgi:tetratricopeptide (TPR) repeat protein
MKNKSIFITAVILLCQWAVFPETSPRDRLDAYIVLYEDGKYEKAQDSLKALLPSLTVKNDIAECYKYIAFTSVMLDMIEVAKRNFQKALLEYPDMTIDTVSVSPNIVVVFNQVKTEHQIKKGQTLAYIVSGALGIACAGASGYFFYAGNQAYNKYNDSRDVDDIVTYREETKTNYLIGQISLCAAVGALGFSAYKFFTRPREAQKVSLDYKAGQGLQFTYRF